MRARPPRLIARYGPEFIGRAKMLRPRPRRMRPSTMPLMTSAPSKPSRARWKNAKTFERLMMRMMPMTMMSAEA